MHTDVERRKLLRERDRVVKRRAVRHERCRGKHAAIMCIENACVHARGQTEIVGVDNQQLQKTESLMRRNFFGFARKSFIRRCISRVAPFRLSYSCWLTSN